MSEWEPKIAAFLCNWCSYGAADLAGVSRLQYAPNIRIIRIGSGFFHWISEEVQRMMHSIHFNCYLGRLLHGKNNSASFNFRYNPIRLGTND